MTTGFMKTFLHRLIKILQFLTRGGIQKSFITLKYSSIFNNMPLAVCVAHIAKGFLICYSCSYYSFLLTETLRILQYDWLRAFQAETEEPDFPHTSYFGKIIKNIVVYHFQGKDTQINGLDFWQQRKKTPKNLFWKSSYAFMPEDEIHEKCENYHMRIFLKIRLRQFLDLKTL